MVTSWLSMEASMFPPKATPNRCHWSLDEPLIRYGRPKIPCMVEAPDGNCWQPPKHAPPLSRSLGSTLCRVDPSGRGRTSRVGRDSSSVLEVVTRIGSIVQPRIGSSSRDRFVWRGAGEAIAWDWTPADRRSSIHAWIDPWRRGTWFRLRSVRSRVPDCDCLHFGGVLSGLGMERCFPTKEAVLTKSVGMLVGGAGLYSLGQLWRLAPLARW